MEEKHKAGIYERYVKRLLDIMCSGVALIVLSPVLLITAILVRVKLGSPVLFSQERPGKDERIFRLYKFRTMTDERDENGNLLPDEVRLTKFGKWLRASSLDDIPELYNIVKGDMSIIGPRPLLIEYLPYYNETERKRHSVRPGLTGLAQINGRNYLEWSKRFAIDVQYVENISFVQDVKILLETIKKIFSRADVAENTSVEEGNFARIRQQEIENQNE